jgi:hypothetical protein
MDWLNVVVAALLGILTSYAFPNNRALSVLAAICSTFLWLLLRNSYGVL